MNRLEIHVANIVRQMADEGIDLSSHEVRRLLRQLTLIWVPFQREYSIRRTIHYVDKRDLDPTFHKALTFGEETRGKVKPIKGTKKPLYLEPLRRFTPVIEQFCEDHGFPDRTNGRSYRIRSDGKGRTIPPWQKLALSASRYFDDEYDGSHWENANRSELSDIKQQTPDTEQPIVYYNEKGESIHRYLATYKPGVSMWDRGKQAEQETDDE